MDSGIGFDDIDMPEAPQFVPAQISRSSVEGILSGIRSGIGLDISKNHTGVCIWDGGKVETYGFAVREYDKSDYHAEYRMRHEFREKLCGIVGGRHFDCCIVEDVYGGTNFDTTRKLLALNTVIDELIFDGACTVGEFVRWGVTEWMRHFRKLYRQKGKLKSKVETQGILEVLGYGFYIENCGLSDRQKKDIFFEDICDATAMLVAMVVKKNTDYNVAKSKPVKISDIKMLYIEDMTDVYQLRDRRVAEEGYICVDLEGRSVEKAILGAVMGSPGDVLCAYLPVSKLGAFGVKHGFEFYESGEGYLLFYNKKDVLKKDA